VLTDYIAENAWTRRTSHDEPHTCWDAGFVVANGGRSRQSCSMKFIEYVRKRAAGLGSTEKEREKFIRHHCND
jgi:hypothetical protein